MLKTQRDQIEKAQSTQIEAIYFCLDWIQNIIKKELRIGPNQPVNCGLTQKSPFSYQTKIGLTQYEEN